MAIPPWLQAEALLEHISHTRLVNICCMHIHIQPIVASLPILGSLFSCTALACPCPCVLNQDC